MLHQYVWMVGRLYVNTNTYPSLCFNLPSTRYTIIRYKLPLFHCLRDHNDIGYGNGNNRYSKEDGQQYGCAWFSQKLKKLRRFLLRVLVSPSCLATGAQCSDTFWKIGGASMMMVIRMLLMAFRNTTFPRTIVQQRGRFIHCRWRYATNITNIGWKNKCHGGKGIGTTWNLGKAVTVKEIAKLAVCMVLWLILLALVTKLQ